MKTLELNGDKTIVTKYFDVKNWVKSYFKLSESDKTLDNTDNSLDFVWVWSIFEHKYLRDSQAVNKDYNRQLTELAQKYPVDKLNVDEIYGFFRERYFQNGRTTRFFGNLNFKTEWQNRAKSILKKSNPDKKEKLEFVLLIIYRFRCNLFHGRKDPLLWTGFDKVFYQINKFLAHFLEQNRILK